MYLIDVAYHVYSCTIFIPTIEHHLSTKKLYFQNYLNNHPLTLYLHQHIKNHKIQLFYSSDKNGGCSATMVCSTIGKNTALALGQL